MSLTITPQEKAALETTLAVLARHEIDLAERVIHRVKDGTPPSYAAHTDLVQGISGLSSARSLVTYIAENCPVQQAPPPPPVDSAPTPANVVRLKPPADR